MEEGWNMKGVLEMKSERWDDLEKSRKFLTQSTKCTTLPATRFELGVALGVTFDN